MGPGCGGGGGGGVIKAAGMVECALGVGGSTVTSVEGAVSGEGMVLGLLEVVEGLGHVQAGPLPRVDVAQARAMVERSEDVASTAATRYAQHALHHQSQCLCVLTNRQAKRTQSCAPRRHGSVG
jgi:hypothetical protein